MSFDVKLAMGLFWIMGGTIVLWGAMLVYSLEKSKKQRKK